MPSPGQFLLNRDGEFQLLPDGQWAVTDSQGNCNVCCVSGACSDQYSSMFDLANTAQTDAIYVAPSSSGSMLIPGPFSATYTNMTTRTQSAGSNQRFAHLQMPYTLQQWNSIVFDFALTIETAGVLGGQLSNNVFVSLNGHQIVAPNDTIVAAVNVNRRANGTFAIWPIGVGGFPESPAVASDPRFTLQQGFQYRLTVTKGILQTGCNGTTPRVIYTLDTPAGQYISAPIGHPCLFFMYALCDVTIMANFQANVVNGGAYFNAAFSKYTVTIS